MKKDLRPTYISPSSYAKKQTIPIDISLDPRLNSLTQNFKIARQNAEYVPIGLNKSIGTFLNTLQNSAITYNADNPADPSGTGGGSGSGSSSPGIPPLGIPPLAVTNLTADYVGDDIKLTFTWDPTDQANTYIYRFKVEVHDSITNQFAYLMANVGYDPINFIDFNSSSQTLILTSKELSLATDDPTGIDIVGVSVCDILNNGPYVTANITNPWQSLLPAPVLGTVTNATDSYSIPITNYTTAKAITSSDGVIILDGVIVYQNLTSISDQNAIDNTKWTQAMPALDSATIIGFAPDDAPRWIRAKFYQKNGGFSPVSNIVKAEPLAFMPVNTNPSAQFASGTQISWSGDDIKVDFVIPSVIPTGQTSPAQVKIKLVPYINGVESTSLYAYYYHTIINGETSFNIKSLDLYSQFGAYYSKFTGYITSVSSQGVETLGSVIVSGPITRSNPLSSIYPVVGTPNPNSPSGIFRITAISNGYVVDFDLPVGANRLEVYEKSTAWTTVPSDDSYMVYSGLSPATVITADNTARYVIVRYYDRYDNTSHYSMEYTGQTSGVQVTPLDIGKLTLIDNPIKISTNGSIFAGAGDSTVYPQVFFNKDGIFAYDSSGNWSTEIINNATTNQPTFITKRAVIGDWTISPVGIQNDLYASSSLKTYTGISASGTYAFWAGAETSNNSDGLANFSVTPAGQVVARKITIVGDGTSSDLINSGGGTFRVTNAGGLTASSANITGTINVNQQSYFNANVNISYGSYLVSSGNQTVKIGAEGLIASTGATTTTKIYSSPIYYLNKEVSLYSKGALFGKDTLSGWLIADGVIQTTSIKLDADNQFIRISAATNGYGLLMSYNGGDLANKAISVGNIDGTPRFYVTHGGDLHAENAYIRGDVQAQAIDLSTSLANRWNSAELTVTAAGLSSGIVSLTAGTVTVGDDTNTNPDQTGSTISTGYTTVSKIQLDSGGTRIFGIPTLGNFTRYNGGGTYYTTDVNPSNPTYHMGIGARQRMLVQDPYDNQVYRGMAVYYGSRSTAPGAGTGYVGDLWVSWA